MGNNLKSIIKDKNVNNKRISNVYGNFSKIFSSKFFCASMIVILLNSIFLMAFNSNIHTNIKILFIPFCPMLALILKIVPKDFFLNNFEISYLNLMLIFILYTIINVFLTITIKFTTDKQNSKKLSDIPLNSSSRTTIQDQNIARHDLRNLLFVVSGYMSVGKYDKAKEKLSHICNTFQNQSVEEPTETLRTIITKLVEAKAIIISEFNINFNYQIIIDEGLNIDSLDICALVGNAIDNSIEACKKLDDTYDKFINLKIFSDKGSINILISNSTSPLLNENLSTSKSDKKSHGLGLKSIKSIVSKYNGSFYLQQIKKVFIIEITLNSALHVYDKAL